MKKTVLLIIITTLSCSQNLRNYNSLELFVPENSLITADEIKKSIPVIKKDGNLRLRIVVYKYSSGKKIISFQGDEYREIDKNGEIKILLKFYQKKSLKEAIFIKSSGIDKKEIIKNISLEIEKVLSST